MHDSRLDQGGDDVLLLDADRASVRTSQLWDRAAAAGLPSLDLPTGDGAETRRVVRVARRYWMTRGDVLPEQVVQSLVAHPRVDLEHGGDAYTDLTGVDEETRAWALLALEDAGLDGGAWRVQIRIARDETLTADEQALLDRAPNLHHDPNPVFAALDDVEDAQRSLQRSEMRRVRAAVAAWRASIVQEADPTASNTAYQKGFFLDLGLKLKIADATARNLVHAADTLERRLPAVWGRFLQAEVPWRAMQIVHAAIDGLDEAVLPAFDEKAAVKVIETPLPRLADALRRLRERLQPDTADERHDRAFRRRRIETEPGADGMGWQHAYLPLPQLTALEHQLTKAAIAAHGKAGESRSIPQLKADIFTDGLIDFLRTAADPEADLLVPARPAVQPKVAIMIPAMTALGHAQAPAILEGYGPIGMRTALKLAGEAKSWVRVLTHPFTGAVLNLERKKYRPTKDMRMLLRLLDGGGRGPGSPARPEDTDVDHLRSYRLHDEEGETSIANLLLLSRKDHGTKTAGQAKLRMTGDRTVVWRTKAGNAYVTRPPEPPDPTPVPPDLLDDDPPPF